MTLSVGPNLGLLVDGALGEEHYDELMAMWRGLDVLVQCRVISTTLATPPASPADGDAYIVAASPTGAWVGHDAKIARWSTVVSTWEFFAPKSGWTVHNVADTQDYRFDGSAWVADGGGASVGTAIPIACSGETTAVTMGTSVVTFHMPFPMALSEVFAGLTTAQTSGTVLTLNVKKNGTTIFSTKITIDNTEETSLTAATPPVLSTTSLAKGDKISIDIDQVGDGTAKGLKVYLIGTVV